MASPSSKDLFGLTQVSSSVSADAAPSFIEVHGFFYHANVEIAALVDDLYSQGRERSAKIDDFRSLLHKDPVSRVRKYLCMCVLLTIAASQQNLRTLFRGTSPCDPLGYNSSGRLLCLESR